MNLIERVAPWRLPVQVWRCSSGRAVTWVTSVLCAGLLCLGWSGPTFAGGFYEVGEVSLSTTVDTDFGGNGWQSVALSKPFVNPVVIAGPLTHNNDLSLVVRIRSVTSTGFEIGMQSACENTGTAAGGVTCPPNSAAADNGWVAETASFLVVEEGVWEMPDARELEAGAVSVGALRSGVSADTTLGVNFLRGAGFANVPAMLHSVTSADDVAGGVPRFIASTLWGDGGTTSDVDITNVAPTPNFQLMLEALEIASVTDHAAETIGWVAVDPGSGSNAGLAYDAGRTAGLAVDRHSDSCDTLPFTPATTPEAVISHNSTNGNNGSFVRRCDNADASRVHMDEDQVNDAERTGIPERVSWFAAEPGFGNLVFLTATHTVADNDGGLLLPGDTLDYSITITNQLNDFAQDDNALPELVIPLPANTSVLSLPAGLTQNGSQLEWNGSLAASASVTIDYQLTALNDPAVCQPIYSSQAVLQMDPNDDGLNTILELSDDPGVDDGVDQDVDSGTADDDPTNMTLAPVSDLAISKQLLTGGPLFSGNQVTFEIEVTNNGPCDATNVVISDTPSNVQITGTSAPCVGTFELGASCTLASLAAGASQTLTVTGTLP